MAEGVVHLLGGERRALRAQDACHLLGMRRVQLGRRTGRAEGADLEDDVGLDEVRQSGAGHRGRDGREQVLDPAAGVGEQHGALVQLLGERDEVRERTRERDLVGDRHRAEVVEHGLDGGCGAEGANGERLAFLGHAQRSRPVLEVARRAPLVADGRPLRQRRDPALRLVEIDREPGVVREQRVADPLLHHRLGLRLGKRHGPSAVPRGGRRVNPSWRQHVGLLVALRDPPALLPSSPSPLRAR